MFPLLLSKGLICIVVRLIANFRLLSDAYSECESKIETADTARFAEHAERILFFLFTFKFTFLLSQVSAQSCDTVLHDCANK